MDTFGDDMWFEMEGFPPHSHPQALLEPCSLHTTRLNSQHSVPPPEGFPVLDEALKNSMSVEWKEPYARFPPETSVQCTTTYINGSVMPPDCTAADNFSWFPQNNVSPQNKHELPVLDQPFNRQRLAQFPTRKRAPKAPTISAKNWASHQDRIRQLYVSEGKSIEELREIMNQELGITAT